MTRFSVKMYGGQKYITRSVYLGNTSMTHQMYEWAIFRFAPSANLRARISNTASDWTNFKSILALNKKCARAIFHIRLFVQSEAVFEIRARRLADGANLKIAHSYIWCVIEVLSRWTLLVMYFWWRKNLRKQKNDRILNNFHYIPFKHPWNWYS